MIEQSSLRILIMAGGTGGHVFPALAVAHWLQEHGARVSWLGTRRGMESRLVPEAGFPMEFISVSGLRGKGMLSWVFAPFKLTLALFQSLQICRRLRPHAVLGMGGFVTGPGGLAAWLLGRPLLIQEQNAIAGMTNRLLSHIADKVMAAFPGAFAREAVITGNPVREAIAQLPDPATRFDQRQGRLRLLIVGGSLGAQALNETVPLALKLVDEHLRPEVWHQSGANKQASTQSVYRESGVEARIVEFINDMAEAYAWADLVICRAGALTVSELAAAGLGAILVPFPHAVDDHQTANASYLVKTGAARVMQQAGMTPEALSATITELLQPGRTGLKTMAVAARRAAVMDSTRVVGEHCLEAAHG